MRPVESLGRKERAYLRDLALVHRKNETNYVDTSHWFDPTFIGLRDSGLVRYVRLSVRKRAVTLTEDGKSACVALGHRVESRRRAACANLENHKDAI